MRTQIFVAALTTVVMCIVAAWLQLEPKDSITLPSRDPDASYCFEATRFRDGMRAIVHLFCSRDIVLEYPASDNEWTEHAKLKGTDVSLMTSVSTLRSSVFKSEATSDGITRVTVSLSPFTTLCLESWDISSRLRVHSAITFNSFYTLTFALCLAAAIITRMFSAAIGTASIILFIFFTLPFILFHAFATKFEPSHPGPIKFLTLSAAAYFIAYLHMLGVFADPTLCLSWLSATSGQAVFVLYSLVVYAVYKMNWFVSATDLKHKVLYTWTAIAASALPVLIIAPKITLPLQVIEDGIVGTSPANPSVVKFLCILLLAKMAPPSVISTEAGKKKD